MKSIRIDLLHQAAAERPAGYLDEVMAAVTKSDDTHVYMTSDDYYRLREKYSGETDFPVTGPGTQLHKILGLFGFAFSKQCKCRARMIQMNKWGCDGCEEHMDEICGWLREEAAARRLPYLDVAGRLLVRRAIANARRESSRASES